MEPDRRHVCADARTVVTRACEGEQEEDTSVRLQASGVRRARPGALRRDPRIEYCVYTPVWGESSSGFSAVLRRTLGPFERGKWLLRTRQCIDAHESQASVRTSGMISMDQLLRMD